jgi:murein tripeptide amidase MpaA
MFDLAKIRPTQVKSRVLGRTPGGRRMVALEVVPAGVSPWKLRRLVVLCRQHGNEPEASASGMRFVREFLTTTDPKKRKIAAKTALLIVPVANPDGAAVYRRRTNKNVDMNRDWGRRKSSEVALLTKWIGAWKPHLVVDVHQWLPNERQPPPMAEASGGPLARRTAQRMAQNSASRGYWLAARSRWGLDTLSHRYWGQRFKIPAILLETRHRPNEAGARDIAIGTSLAALWSAAETVSR